MKPVVRNVYRYNPGCECDWCRNGGVNPQPGAPATLGYAEPHIPPAGPREVVLSTPVPGRPGEIFEPYVDRDLARWVA